jgi:preprotein translocase subunit SecD
MRKHSSLLLVFIILLTLITLIINIPPSITLKFETPTIPVINQKISVDRKINGFNPNFFIGPFHFEKDLSFKKGLDLEGGTSITLRANMQEVKPENRDAALESAKDVIERRINFFGVSEPIVQTAKTQNDHRIIVEIPGVTDVNQALSLIGTTAKLSFWEQGASGSGKLDPNLPNGGLPFGMTQLLGPDAKKTDLSGEDLQSANVAFDPQTGRPQVQLVFTPDGSKKFATITRRNVGKIVAIALDNTIIEAPRVNEPITGGSAVISGGFTTEQAKALRIQLNAGALPVSLSVLEQHAIGATLGQQSLDKSLFAGLIGFIVIVIFMSVLYGRLGLIASLALVVYTLIVLTLFRLIPVTLTLAGIAGFILSIGIAVDANILIFDRTIEELRRGRSRETALDIGFKRAWSSIRDSNVASIITSILLYIFGNGMVKGFAVTLFIGVIISMFSAITVTRTFLNVYYRSKGKK